MWSLLSATKSARPPSSGGLHSTSILRWRHANLILRDIFNQRRDVLNKLQEPTYSLKNGCFGAPHWATKHAIASILRVKVEASLEPPTKRKHKFSWCARFVRERVTCPSSIGLFDDIGLFDYLPEKELLGFLFGYVLLISA